MILPHNIFGLHAQLVLYNVSVLLIADLGDVLSHPYLCRLQKVLVKMVPTQQ
jgi:hypothetical protein|tara:strand:- start:713 stop:868 length:156 start_codon:yes stop_codon:yes gene_type:complete